VNRSEEGFTIEEGAIRYGLSAIKNVGASSVEAILDARRRVGPFRDLFHFCLEVDRLHLNRRVLENLVQSGAMDCFGAPRWDLIASLDPAMAAAVKSQEDKARGQAALFGGEEWTQAPPAYAKGEAWSDLERFSREKTSLGFYLSGHPLMEQQEVLRRYATHTLWELGHLAEPAEVTVGGIVSQWHQRKSKSKGEMYGIMTLEDLEARVEVLLFNEVYRTHQEKVAKDAALLVVGTASRDEQKTKIIASSVVPLKDADAELEMKAASVQISVPSRLCDEDFLAELEAVLRRHRGGLNVYMDVVEEGARVTKVLLGGCRVKAGKALLEDLQAVLGKGRVHFLFRAANGSGRDRSSAKPRR
jgi:DNA polymerase-3 subunit alpha